MKTLIRIVFVIFIANGIDCLGRVCDDFCGCCDCLKKKEYEEIEGDKEKNKNEKIKEYEEIKEDKNITAKSLVNKDWFEAKENKPVLKIFKKKDDNAIPSEGNGDKISIKLEGKNNTKIAYLQKKEDELNLKGKKYAFFEIKTKTNNTVYSYCSDVESCEFKGIFKGKEKEGIFNMTDHVSISVIACDTEKVTDMSFMFATCSSLTKLDLQNFNTTNVTDMKGMFDNCGNLTELDLQNFNTTNVEDMGYMFTDCINLTKLKVGKNFNVKKKWDMFVGCTNLTKDTVNKILKPQNKLLEKIKSFL